MMNPPSQDKLAVHTVTTKPWSLRECVGHFSAAGVQGITVWRDKLEEMPPAEAKALIADHGMKTVSLCRGGFFPADTEAGRQQGLDDNRKAIEEAEALGAPLIVLVCGAVPGQPLTESRKQIQEGIEAVLPLAQEAGVKLDIEPLHPMYADSRSAVNTLGQANDLVEAIGSPDVGVAVDVYHLWWDPNLEREIARCGKLGALHAFHICDWRTPTRDLLLDREIMGRGCIPIQKIRSWVEAAGFRGYNEVEIFSKDYWEQDQQAFLGSILEAYQKHS